MKVYNLFNLDSINREDEDIKLLSRLRNIRIERIVSTGQESDWYNQDEDEFIALIKGEARLILIDDFGCEKELELKEGDTLMIPAHKKHRVSYTKEGTETVWLCFFIR